METTYKIEDGLVRSSYFWFCPVSFKNGEKPDFDTVIKHEFNAFSIEEDIVFEFFKDFFYNFFDGKLKYNAECESRDKDIPLEFDPYGMNFYTYDTMNDMLKEIFETKETMKKFQVDTVAKLYEDFIAKTKRALNGCKKADIFMISGL